MSKASPSISLRLAAQLKDLVQIRHFVQESAESLGIATGDLPTVLLAVDEAVTNVIVHGYGGRGGPLEIEVTRSSDALVIRLRDKASQFDPTGVAAPDTSVPLEKREPGGLGIHLIRQVMDQLIYHYQPDAGNELTMTKYLGHAGS